MPGFLELTTADEGGMNGSIYLNIDKMMRYRSLTETEKEEEPRVNAVIVLDDRNGRNTMFVAEACETISTNIGALGGFTAPAFVLLTTAERDLPFNLNVSKISYYMAIPADRQEGSEKTVIFLSGIDDPILVQDSGDDVTAKIAALGVPIAHLSK